MAELYAQYSSEIWSFLGGLLSGIGGSFIAIKVSRRNTVKGKGMVVDQSSAKAGGDIIGGSKTMAANQDRGQTE